LRRIVSTQADLNRVLHYRAKNFKKTVCAIRLLSSRSHQLDDVLTSHIRRALFAIPLALRIRFATEAVENIPVNRLRVCFHRAESK